MSKRSQFCVTGYARDWSCLSGLFRDSELLSDTRDLYKHMIHPDFGASLSFIGWARPAEGGVPTISEMQARYLSLVLAQQRNLPRDLQAATQLDKAADQTRFFLTPSLNSLVHYPIIMDQLAELIGCRVNLFLLFFTDHALWRRLWFGAQLGCVYRLCGPDSTPQLARRTIEQLAVAWFANEKSTNMAMKLLVANAISFIGTPFGLCEASW